MHMIYFTETKCAVLEENAPRDLVADFQYLKGTTRKTGQNLSAGAVLTVQGVTA